MHSSHPVGQQGRTLLCTSTQCCDKSGSLKQPAPLQPFCATAAQISWATFAPTLNPTCIWKLAFVPLSGSRLQTTYLKIPFSLGLSWWGNCFQQLRSTLACCKLSQVFWPSPCSSNHFGQAALSLASWSNSAMPLDQQAT